MSALEPRSPDAGAGRLSLECSTCGYGIARSAPPDRCPLCQRSGPWLPSRRQPLGESAWRLDLATGP